MSLDIFGFRALWSPFFLTFLIVVTVGYFFLIDKYKYKIEESKRLTSLEIRLFLLAMVLIYIIKGSPLDLMGHLMFYAHMIQMSVLLFIIPPILIVALPVWIWRYIWSLPVIKTILLFFTRPIIALVLFNVTFSLYHIPFVFDVIKTTMWLHEAYTGLLFMLALSMWWPLMNKVDKNRSIVGLKKVAYIFASGALILPACALIIFNDSPMYAAYSDPNLWAQALALCVPQATLASLDLSGPEMFTSLSLVHDQQLGGILMKIIQEIVYGIVLARVFFEWYRKDQEETEAEQLNGYQPQPVE
ncbi:cytochrome c oxidase assembly factor CtaG [Bacillus tuaregi]|uniref:cytochrome c oxidase assembly factor CtaG n=1 Tax=Bacillus tuaregi TaxID=1816695 RepID=UPI0008F946CF|nr:cytochrome c oxidase assembly factor CtaG [Bacillus tuaregi]